MLITALFSQEKYHATEVKSVVEEQVTVIEEIVQPEPFLSYSEDLEARIIYCESENKADAVNYNKINGEVWSIDYGYWQLNDYYHEEAAKEMGLDIKVPADNLEYGRWLLKKEGVKPWEASRYCWSRA